MKDCIQSLMQTDITNIYVRLVHNSLKVQGITIFSLFFDAECKAIVQNNRLNGLLMPLFSEML